MFAYFSAKSYCIAALTQRSRGVLAAPSSKPYQRSPLAKQTRRQRA
jgi:hypothetical protein